MTALWGADDAPPDRRSCQCDFCASDDLSVEDVMRAKASLQHHDHEVCGVGPGGPCDDCRQTIRQMDRSELRREEDCELADHDARTRTLTQLYQQIDAGWLDPMGAELPMLQVAEIGEMVTSRAEQDRLDAVEDESNG